MTEKVDSWECDFSPSPPRGRLGPGVCPICDKEFKKLGSHLQHCEKKPKKEPVHVPEKPVGDIVGELKKLLKRYHIESLSYVVEEIGGAPNLITVRIRLK